MTHLPDRAPNTARRWCAAATLAAMLLAAGCAASPAVRYHTLQAIAPTAPAVAYAGPVVQVAGMRLPAQLDRAELLHETAPGRLGVSENDHWAALLPKLARQALAEDLAARLPEGRTTFPGAAWPRAEAQLSVDILSFTLRDGVASMQLSWSLRRAGVDAPESGAQWQLQTRAADPAAGLSALLAQLADRIAADLASRPSRLQR